LPLARGAGFGETMVDIMLNAGEFEGMNMEALAAG
jgi:hypothetical protein